MKEPNFGDKVTCFTHYKRTHQSSLNSRVSKVFWEEVFRKKHQPVKGVFIGWRTLSNGDMNYGEDREYKPTKNFKAALVVFSSRTNPVYVPYYQVCKSGDNV